MGPFRQRAVNRNRFLEFSDPFSVGMVDQQLVETLVQKGLELAASAGGELERSCWMVVHEHHHGVKPTEYDIREIDEQLYLEVLKLARQA